MLEELQIGDKITFYGRVSREELADIYPNMDALLLTLCSEKQIGFAANTVPAKFQNYLSVGKPIIAAIDGGAKEIIDETGCGLAVCADDDDGLAKVMKKFIESPNNYYECGKKGMAYFEKNYEKRFVMDQIELYLNKLVIGVNE